VAAGGAVGTLLRALAEETLPARGGFPVATLGVNLIGAFLLGALLETLARRGPDTGRRRMLRLGLGTGVLGGFTTYSTLAVEAATLPPALGAAYLAGTAVLGAAASIAGILLGRRLA
jgi:CrcB protein